MLTGEPELADRERNHMASRVAAFAGILLGLSFVVAFVALLVLAALSAIAGYACMDRSLCP